MNYQEKIIDNEDLSNDVICYWQMDGLVPNSQSLQSRYIPRGQGILLFNFGDPIEQIGLEGKIKVSDPFIIKPVLSRGVILNQKGDVNLFGISFITEGLYKLIQEPRLKLAQSFPKALKQQLISLHKNLEQINFEERVVLIEQFLLTNMNQNEGNQNLQVALEEIRRMNGTISIYKLAKRTRISERQLQRLFKKYIGISPKEYCKIVRVNKYIDLILKMDQPIDWMDLVVKYDYNDQPHLINEVKSISQLSPENLSSFRDTLYHRYLPS